MRNETSESSEKETPNAIEVRGISKRFGVVQALDNVSLAVPRATIHGVVGQNGAGKSTLMQIISGVFTADAGALLLNGSRVTMRDPDHARRLGVRIIYQELNLTPYQTIAENIFLGIEPRNRLGLVNRRVIRKRSRELLNRLGSSLPVDVKIEELSIGQQQLVEIAKALAWESQILILDEPTAALELQDIERLFDVLMRFREHGGSALYVSHRLGELFRICDSVTVLRDGFVVSSGAIADTNHDGIVKMMLGRPLSEVFPPLRGRKDAVPIVQAQGLVTGGLRDVSFEARAGCILGVVGLEGSGIRELGRVLIGDEPLDQGEVVIGGKRRRLNRPAVAVKSGVVYLSSDRRRDGLFPILSVSHNISVGSLRRESRAGVINRRHERRIVEDGIRKLSIRAPSTAQEVRFLSGGNQQKVLLARWLGTEPKVFVMDEPTRGIDVGSKAEIYSIMRELADRGAAVIMVSTDVTEVLGMSDEILVLHAGEIAARLPGGVSESEVLPHVLGVAA
jgi:ABC-type sugar transport system ATPase subunit